MSDENGTLYLYAITDQAQVPLCVGPGLHGISPYGLVHRDIAAVVSPLPQAKVLPTEANAWLHESVVEALMAERTVLPARFGTILAGEALVQAALMAHYDNLVANLRCLRGRVELGLRVLWDDDEPSESSRQPTNSSGRAYLLARFEEQRLDRAWRERAGALAAELHNTLAQKAADSTYQVLLTPRLLLTAAYLVERDQLTTFKAAVHSLREDHPILRFLFTGPWPAYSFARIALRIAQG